MEGYLINDIGHPNIILVEHDKKITFTQFSHSSFFPIFHFSFSTSFPTHSTSTIYEYELIYEQIRKFLDGIYVSEKTVVATE